MSRIVVIDQNKVEFAVLVVIKKLTMVAQVFDKITVAIDVCEEIAEVVKQRAFILVVAWIEFPYFGIKLVVKKERATLGAIFEWQSQAVSDNFVVIKFYYAYNICIVKLWKLNGIMKRLPQTSGNTGFRLRKRAVHYWILMLWYWKIWIRRGKQVDSNRDE